jgi:UDP-N-acetylmuramoyl-tripeptide--D-alanyl-D-alanine ligase
MLELGADAAKPSTRAWARPWSLADVDRLVVVGPGAAPIGDGAVAAGMPPTHLSRVPDTDTAYELLSENLRPGDVVLVKSSNAAGLRWLGDRVAETVTGSEVGS